MGWEVRGAFTASSSFCRLVDNYRNGWNSATVMPPLHSTLKLSSLPACLPFRVRIHQRTDHALVGHVALLGFALEEIEATARQRERHLDVLLAWHEVGGRGQEILDHPDAADFSRRVSNGSVAHRVAFLSANSRRRRCGFGYRAR